MAENNTKQNVNLEASDWKWFRIFLLVAAPLGYTLAYTHELGYCDVFKIPKELITLDWTTVIIGVSAAFGGSMLLLWFTTMLLIPGQSKQQRGPVRRRLYFFFVMFLLLFSVTYKYLLMEELIYVVAYLVTLAMLLFFIPVLDKNTKEVKGYRNKLVAYDELQKKSETPFLKRFGLKGVLLVMFLIGAFVFSYLEGRTKAMNQEEFYVPSTYPDSVVLRIYGDNVICAPLDRVEREVERRYFVLRLNDEQRPILIATQTGRLHVRE